jgi:Zn-finger nucleic acid-binding protein
MTDIGGERKKGLEEDYFHRKDRELLEHLRQRSAAHEGERYYDAFSLRCHKCGEELEEILFRGIIVDLCIGCHGVWLDSDEVEHLTSRASQGWLSLFWRNFGRYARTAASEECSTEKSRSGLSSGWFS